MSADLLIDLPFVALFVLAPWIAARCVRARLSGGFRGVAAPLAEFTLAATIVVVLVIALGTAGILTRPVLAVALAGLCLVALAVRRRVPPAVGEGLPAGPLDGNSGRRLPVFDVAVLSFVTVLSGLALFTILLQAWRDPPLAYDALMYHLVFPAEWIQRGRLDLVPTWFAAPANSYFPCNAEATFTYLMLATGDEKLVGFSQFPFLLAGAGALAGIARRCSLSPAASALVALVFLCLPEVSSQAGSALVDIDFAACFLLAVFFLMEYGSTGSRACIIAGGCAIGLMAGTKSIALLFGVLLLPLAVAALLAQAGRPRSSALPDGLLLCASVIPLGAFWYLRNWELTGNPFFPLSIGLGGTTIFHGAHGPEEMLASRFHIPAMNAKIHALARLAGPVITVGPLTSDGPAINLPLLLILLAAALPFAAIRLFSQPGGRMIIGYLLLLPVLMLELFARVNPYNTQYRFFFPGLALSLLVLGAAFDRAGLGGRLVAGAACIVMAAGIFSWPPEQDPRMEVFAFPALSFSLAAAAAAVVAALLQRGHNGARVLRTARRLWRVPAALPVTFAVLAVVLTAAQPLLSRSYLSRAGEDRDGQRAFIWGTLRGEDTPLTIAFTGFNQPYPLYGPDFRNLVVHVGVDGRQGYNLHDYLALIGQEGGPEPRRSYKPAYYRSRPDVDAWLRGIESMKVDRLVVSRFSVWDREEFEHDGDGFPWENRWARERPERFEPILETADIRVYRVRRTSGPDAARSGESKAGGAG